MSHNALIPIKRVMAMISTSHTDNDRSFAEFRGKVRRSELLSASTTNLLFAVQFTGRLSVILQNGKVLKSGYEEGYFRNVESEVKSTVQ